MANNIIKIVKKKKLFAVIIRAGFKQNGLTFLVPDEYPQQLAYMNRPQGHIITPHIHKPVLRKIKNAQETLFVRSGSVRIDFYDEKKCYIESRIARSGDVVFLAFGGHGFKFMDNAEIIEVKQGPFIKGNEPVRFEAIAKNNIKVKK